MAYTHPDLQRQGPANSDYPVAWAYSTPDTQGAVGTSGYFDDASDDLTVGDFIHANVATGGTLVAVIYYVVSNAGGVVDVSAGLVVT